MEKKKKVVKNRRRLRIDRICLALLIVGLCVFGVIQLLQLKITKVYIEKEQRVSEEQLRQVLFPSEYPSLLFTSKQSLLQKAQEVYPIIQDFRIRKSLFGTLTIEVIEHRILFIYQDSYILEDGTTLPKHNVNQTYLAPELLVKTAIEEDIYQKLIEKMNEIEESILERISEISYVPNDEKDQERFLFLMNDGNYAYATLSKLNKLNLYDSIKKKLEGKRGILYFDSLREGDLGITYDVFDS